MTKLSRRNFISMTSISALGIITACTRPLSVESANTVDPIKSVSSSPVRYDFIRNATARLHYAGKVLLLDPMLSPKGALPSFAGIAPNPTVDLPMSANTIIEGIDAVIVSHLHSDHFDERAAALLPKDIPMFTPRNTAFTNPQDPSDRPFFKKRLQDMGFTNVKEIARFETGSVSFDGITLHQVWGRHGKGQVGDLLGNVNGIVIQAKGHPTIYWAGDTILDDTEMNAILSEFKPDIIIAHTGGPVIKTISPELLLMDAAQGTKFFEQAQLFNPGVKMIAVHMNALDHCFSTRADLSVSLAGLGNKAAGKFFIPEDGQTIMI